MKILTVLTIFLISFSSLAETYTCSGSGYHLSLFNQTNRTEAIIVDWGDGEEVFSWLNIRSVGSFFEVEYLARKDEGHIRSIEISIPIVNLGETTAAKLLIQKANQNKLSVSGIKCTRGGDELP